MIIPSHGPILGQEMAGRRTGNMSPCFLVGWLRGNVLMLINSWLLYIRPG